VLVTAQLALSGCAAGSRGGPARLAPAPAVSEATWRQVEQDIILASLSARSEASAYGRSAIEQWVGRVRRYTDEKFIPWYSRYWTQEWLALKVALYRSNDSEGDAAAVRRLAGYLQDKYVSQVLEPASQETDPNGILRQATAMYVRALGDQIERIGERYQLPERALRDRLDQVPAIVLRATAGPGASLGRLTERPDASGLPAYDTLIQQIETAGVDVYSRPSEGRLSPIASAVAETFVRKIVARGGAAAAAAVVGGPAGFAVSLGITGWSVAQHNKHKPELEAQLRGILYPALEQMQRKLLEDPERGVLGAVNHIHGWIEYALRAAPVPTRGTSPEYPW